MPRYKMGLARCLHLAVHFPRLCSDPISRTGAGPLEAIDAHFAELLRAREKPPRGAVSGAVNTPACICRET